MLSESLLCMYSLLSRAMMKDKNPLSRGRIISRRSSPRLCSVKLKVSQLIDKTESQLCMLKHMIKAQILNLVIFCMNTAVIPILAIRLCYECRRITRPCGRSMVGAGKATREFDIRNITVLFI